ncbi:hypothetical protein OUZ56_003513 [Daphnia magna]|uniref:Uncharacterized protein n=1 Tax=Daphnia magna TaxID=35525 RepID=A0ABR0A8Y3_9CRUS|nr:hypothetical protein OUZ56_003513 [Daphnia magna]
MRYVLVVVYTFHARVNHYNLDRSLLFAIDLFYVQTWTNLFLVKEIVVNVFLGRFLPDSICFLTPKVFATLKTCADPQKPIDFCLEEMTTEEMLGLIWEFRRDVFKLRLTSTSKTDFLKFSV